MSLIKTFWLLFSFAAFRSHFSLLKMRSSVGRNETPKTLLKNTIVICFELPNGIVLQKSTALESYSFSLWRLQWELTSVPSGSPISRRLVVLVIWRMCIEYVVLVFALHDTFGARPNGGVLWWLHVIHLHNFPLLSPSAHIPTVFTNNYEISLFFPHILMFNQCTMNL